MNVFVVTIAYDYGVVEEAGAFVTEAKAREWIEAENGRRLDQHWECLRKWPDEDWGDFVPTDYCVVALALNED